jgi:hypothetical protein
MVPGDRETLQAHRFVPGDEQPKRDLSRARNSGQQPFRPSIKIGSNSVSMQYYYNYRILVFKR